jgi:hypothetical protein
VRIERRKHGTLVRVLLSRTEVREAARAARAGTLMLPENKHGRSVRVVIGKTADTPGVLHVQFDLLKEQCKVIAEAQIDIPKEAAFEIGVDNADGRSVAGVTFSWWELEDSSS